MDAVPVKPATGVKVIVPSELTTHVPTPATTAVLGQLPRAVPAIVFAESGTRQTLLGIHVAPLLGVSFASGLSVTGSLPEPLALSESDVAPYGAATVTTSVDCAYVPLMSATW